MQTSNTDLKEEIKTRLTTVMIGSLVAIEKRFGHLFGQNKRKGLTPEELKMKKIFLKLRDDILKLGNDEILKMEEDLKKYKVRHHYELKVEQSKGE